MRSGRPIEILLLAASLGAAAVLAGSRAGSALAQSPPSTLAAAPGDPPGFAIDAEGRLLVVDHVRGFLVGRFQAPAYLGAGAPSGEGGVALEAPLYFGPELPAVPLTTFRSQRGFPSMSSGPIAASPCVADLDRDGRMETVVAGIDGTIDLISAAGEPAAGWPQQVADECYAPPSVADLGGDADLEILIAGLSGTLYAFHLDSTAVAGWPVTLSTAGENPAPIFGAPAVGDLDGDGDQEICVANVQGTVWALDGRGNVLPGWPQNRPASLEASDSPGVLASPALADLDGRPGLEIVIGSSAGLIFAWRESGELLPGWPAAIPGLPRAGVGDPAVGDVDGDGHLEIVVVCERTPDRPARAIVLDAAGRTLPGWPVDLPDDCNAGAALGDLNADGAAEIVIATIGGTAALLALDGRQAAPLPGWPVHFSDQTINAVPLIADLDGDGSLDALVATLSTGTETHAWLWAGDREGRELRAFPVFLPYDEIVRAAPVAADLEGDGDLELVCATEVLNRVYAWELEALCEAASLPWPAQGAGPSRRGVLEPAPGQAAGAGEKGAAAPTPSPDADSSPLPPELVNGAGTPLDAPPGPETNAGDNGALFQDPVTGVLPTIPFELAEETQVRLIVFDIKGTRIRRLLDQRLPPGRYGIYWDGKDDAGRPQTSGIYFYQLGLGERSATRQLLLLK